MVNYKILDNLNLIVFSLTGTVSAKEVIKIVQSLKTKDEINPGINAVIDTRAQINVLTRDEILKIFYEMVGVDRNPFVNKTAIIAVSNEEFGTGKLYSVYKNKIKVEIVVFYDIDKASKWLGIPKDNTPF